MFMSTRIYVSNKWYSYWKDFYASCDHQICLTLWFWYEWGWMNFTNRKRKEIFFSIFLHLSVFGIFTCLCCCCCWQLLRFFYLVIYLSIRAGQGSKDFITKTLNLFKILYVSRKINTKQLGKKHSTTTTTPANLHDIQIDKACKRSAIRNATFSNCKISKWKFTAIKLANNNSNFNHQTMHRNNYIQNCMIDGWLDIVERKKM